MTRPLPQREPGWARREPGWSRREPGWSRREPGWSRREPGWSRRGPGWRAVVAMIVLLATGAAGCARRGQVPEVEPYLRSAYWQAFPLPMGGSAVFPDSVVVTFEAVSDDSRCPRGAECVHAGRAVVLLTVWTASGEVDSLHLETASGAPARGLVRDYDFELRRLLPEPVVDVAIAPADYTAILVVGKY